VSLPQLAIEKRAVTYFATALILVGGIFSFFQLGWLEDPDFSVKAAVIVTAYPGATAEEVELEVTDRLETAVKELSQVREVFSLSRPGSSIIRVDIKPQYWMDDLPQVWDELRNKVEDVETRLPPGARPPEVADDFGFVYGFLMALTGDGYSYKELEDYAEYLQTQLGVVDGVARVELWGVQQRVVYVDVSEQQLSQVGIAPGTIEATLRQQNMVLDAGGIDAQDQRFRFAPTGSFESPEDIDGISYLPELLGHSEAQEKHDYFYWIWAIRVGKWKLHRKGKDRFALYDLENDIAEKHNLADKMPEIVTRHSRYFDEATRK